MPRDSTNCLRANGALPGRIAVGRAARADVRAAARGGRVVCASLAISAKRMLLLAFATHLGVDRHHPAGPQRACARSAARPHQPARAGRFATAGSARIPGREVVRGDVVVISEGDRVPADGVLIAGDHVAAGRIAADRRIAGGAQAGHARNSRHARCTGRRRLGAGVLRHAADPRLGLAGRSRHRHAQRHRRDRPLARAVWRASSRGCSARRAASC